MTDIILDITPPPRGADEAPPARIEVGIVEPSRGDGRHLILTVSSYPSNPDPVFPEVPSVWREIPYGPHHPRGSRSEFPKDATISLVANGAELGRVPVTELYAAMDKGYPNILQDYATALSNGGTQTFAEFAVAQEKDSKSAKERVFERNAPKESENNSQPISPEMQEALDKYRADKSPSGNTATVLNAASKQLGRNGR